MVVRGEVWLTALNPPVGSEIQKSRPCVVISPPEIHDHVRTVIVAPMSTGNKPAPFRVVVAFEGKQGLILLDQIRSLDQSRLIKRLGVIDGKVLSATLSVLQEIFAE